MFRFATATQIVFGWGALAELPRVHAAVLIGRKRGMDDVTLARVTNIPRPLLDTYYSQAYVIIRCKAWNA